MVFSEKAAEKGIFPQNEEKIIDFSLFATKGGKYFSRKLFIFGLLASKPQNILFLTKNPNKGKKYFLGKKI